MVRQARIVVARWEPASRRAAQPAAIVVVGPQWDGDCECRAALLRLAAVLRRQPPALAFADLLLLLHAVRVVSLEAARLLTRAPLLLPLMLTEKEMFAGGVRMSKPVFWPQKTPPHSPRLCDSSF